MKKVRRIFSCGRNNRLSTNAKERFRVALEEYEHEVNRFKKGTDQIEYKDHVKKAYLKEADDAHLSRDLLGQRLVYADTYIICENAAYVVCKNEDNSIVETVEISQNAAGVDTEDRIVKLKAYLKNTL